MDFSRYHDWQGKLKSFWSETDRRFVSLFYKKLLGLQGVKPLHWIFSCLPHGTHLRFGGKLWENKPESACPMANSRGQGNPETGEKVTVLGALPFSEDGSGKQPSPPVT